MAMRQDSALLSLITKEVRNGTRRRVRESLARSSIPYAVHERELCQDVSCSRPFDYMTRSRSESETIQRLFNIYSLSLFGDPHESRYRKIEN